MGTIRLLRQGIRVQAADQARRGGPGPDGAIAIVVTTTIAAARTASLLHSGHPLHAALSGGFHDAFAVIGVVAVVGALAAVTLVRRTPAAAAAEPSASADLTTVNQTVSPGDIDVS